MIRPKSYQLMDMCIEHGVERGLHRAYKHNDNPTKEQISDAIQVAVMHEISEWFHFDDPYDKLED